MTESIKVNNSDLTIKEYNGQRVVTFKDIDEVHNIANGTARKNFTRNKSHFVLNEDYWILRKSEVGGNMSQTFGFGKSANTGILIAESGYLMLTKSLTDDLAWKVQRQLVNIYFKAKPEAKEKYVSDDILASLLYQNQAILQKLQYQQDTQNLYQAQMNTVLTLITTTLPRPYNPPFTKWIKNTYKAVDYIAGRCGATRRQILNQLYNELQNTHEIDLSDYQADYCAQHNLGQAHTINVIDSDAQLKQWFDGILIAHVNGKSDTIQIGEVNWD